MTDAEGRRVGDSRSDAAVELRVAAKLENLAVLRAVVGAVQALAVAKQGSMQSRPRPTTWCSWIAKCPMSMAMRPHAKFGNGRNSKVCLRAYPSWPSRLTPCKATAKNAKLPAWMITSPSP